MIQLVLLLLLQPISRASTERRPEPGVRLNESSHGRNGLTKILRMQLLISNSPNRIAGYQGKLRDDRSQAVAEAIVNNLLGIQLQQDQAIENHCGFSNLPRES